jgi:hypothetical protein
VSDTRYIVEPGLARGFWVLDSWSVSDRARRRYMKWFGSQQRADAESHTAEMNRRNAEVMAA